MSFAYIYIYTVEFR